MRSRENRLQGMRPVGILILQIKMLYDFMSYKALWNTDMPMEDRDQKIKFQKVSNTLHLTKVSNHLQSHFYNHRLMKQTDLKCSQRKDARNTVTMLKVFDVRDCGEIIE